MTASAVPFDVVQLVVQGGAAGVLALLGWQALALFKSLLTDQLGGLREDVSHLTSASEKMIDRLDLILTATLLGKPAEATPQTIAGKAEQVAKLKEDVATVVEQTTQIKNGEGTILPERE